MRRHKGARQEIRWFNELNEFLEEVSAFFAASRRKPGKTNELKFIAQKTEDGLIKGKISFYCEALRYRLQAIYGHLKKRNKPWMHEHLAERIKDIIAEDECTTIHVGEGECT